MLRFQKNAKLKNAPVSKLMTDTDHCNFQVGVVYHDIVHASATYTCMITIVLF